MKFVLLVLTMAAGAAYADEQYVSAYVESPDGSRGLIRCSKAEHFSNNKHPLSLQCSVLGVTHDKGVWVDTSVSLSRDAVETFKDGVVRYEYTSKYHRCLMYKRPGGIPFILRFSGFEVLGDLRAVFDADASRRYSTFIDDYVQHLEDEESAALARQRDEEAAVLEIERVLAKKERRLKFLGSEISKFCHNLYCGNEQKRASEVEIVKRLGAPDIDYYSTVAADGTVEKESIYCAEDVGFSMRYEMLAGTFKLIRVFAVRGWPCSASIK